jgi:predicted hydrocarbon binding protein
MIETLKLEEGKVTMCNIPFIFTFTKSIYYMQKELEKVAGKDWKKICYDCGKVDCISCNINYRSMYRDDPLVQKLFSDQFEAFKFCVEELNRMGKGRLEITLTDNGKLPFVLRFYFSPIALAYLEHDNSKEPVCHHFAGIWAGGTTMIYPGAEVTETKCVAKGDPYCEFVIEIPTK